MLKFGTKLKPIRLDRSLGLILGNWFRDWLLKKGEGWDEFGIGFMRVLSKSSSEQSRSIFERVSRVELLLAPDRSEV